MYPGVKPWNSGDWYMYSEPLRSAMPPSTRICNHESGRLCSAPS